MDIFLPLANGLSDMQFDQPHKATSYTSCWTVQGPTTTAWGLCRAGARPSQALAVPRHAKRSYISCQTRTVGSPTLPRPWEIPRPRFVLRTSPLMPARYNAIELRVISFKKEFTVLAYTVEINAVENCPPQWAKYSVKKKKKFKSV